jgi:5-methylthioadenosine/S-adenosylhomocysteine deaminase
MQLICPEWIAPVVPDERVLTEHAVAIDDDRIVALLPLAEARRRFPEAQALELPAHLLTPGLVNLHCHAAMTLLRGAGDDMPLQQWLEQRIWPIERRLLSPDFVFDGSLLACAEMVLSGITCFNDMYFFPEQTAAAARVIGMRAALGIISVEFPSAYGTGPAEYLRKGLELRDQLREDPLVSFCLAPHAPYTVSDASLEQVASLCAELGLPIHMHLHETAAEVADAVARSGERPLQRIVRLGLAGPDLIAVHAVHLDASDLALIAEHRISVAHCPHSNLKLASGIAPAARMLELGINVGIGTDGAASNNRLDLLSEARTAALLAKGTTGNAAAWRAPQMLEALTMGGARALGLSERIGSIEPGKQADLMAVELRAAELAPVFDPVSHLLHAAGREHVREVWIAGRHVVRKRQLTDGAAAMRLSEVVGRSRLWQNRIAEILPWGRSAP